MGKDFSIPLLTGQFALISICRDESVYGWDGRDQWLLCELR